MTPITHAELVAAGARWLRNAKKCKAVLIECGSWSFPELPDAIGFRPDGESFLVEAKVSMADLRAQFKKPSSGPRGMGRHRWFLVPDGFHDTPFDRGDLRGWGLLIAARRGGGFRLVEELPSSHDEWNGQAEAALLVAELARLSIVSGQAPGRRNGMQGLSVKPVELPLACPACGAWHVDDGSCTLNHYGLPNAKKAHRKHICRALIHGERPCGHRWTPTELFPTVGVLPKGAPSNA